MRPSPSRGAFPTIRPKTPYSRAILQHIEDADVVVPEISAFEIANGIFVAYSKRKRIDEVDIYEYVQLLESLPIRVVRGDWLKNITLESLVSPTTIVTAASDPDDNIFLECAEAASAHYLVTGNQGDFPDQ